MTPQHEIDQLDTFINDLNDGFAPDVSATTQSDADDLFAAVLEIRRLAATTEPADDFPARAADRISNALRSRAEVQQPQKVLLASFRNGRAPDAPTPIQRTYVVDHLPRRWQIRDVAQMAAAILALVLLAGMLAVVFQSQGGHEPSGIGAGSTTTRSSTVTVNDPALSALQEKAGFQIYAPTWLPPTWSLEPPTQPSRVTGYSEVRLTYLDASQSIGVDIFEAAPLQLTSSMFPTNVYDSSQEVDMGGGRRARVYQQAGLTRLWWQEGNVAIQLQSGYATLGGDDTFPVSQSDIVRIASSMVPVAKNTAVATPIPSPTRFGYHDQLSIAEAQQLVGFRIIEPSPLPDVLTHPSLNASALKLLPTGSTAADFVTLMYPSNDLSSGLIIDETTLSTTLPVVLHNMLHLTAADGQPLQMPVSSWTRDSLSIKNVPVSKLDTVQDGSHVLYYYWQQGDTYFVAYGRTTTQLSEAVMVRVVTSMIGQSAGGASPPAQASPTSDGAALLPLLTPSAKLATKEAASQWAIDYASAKEGPKATVVQAQLMTLDDAIMEAGNQNWLNSDATGVDSNAPVWVVEVAGASVDHSCPQGTSRAGCSYNHVTLVVDANTAKLVGLIDPHSDPATPTP